MESNAKSYTSDQYHCANTAKLAVTVRSDLRLNCHHAKQFQQSDDKETYG